jgi:threonine/homoserine efflux transporter RhtA
MTELATIVCLVLALGTVLPCAVKALRDRPVGRLEVTAAGLLEVGVLFYVIVRIADLIGGHRPSSLAVAIAYLIGILLVMPVAAALGIVERTRWGPIVLGVGALVVCVLFARIDQVWRPHG